jgi:hypothetical protein
MSDTIWAALIAVIGSGSAAALTGLLTLRSTKAQAAVTIRAVEQQGAVELAKVEAENRRLQAQHREDERQRRQGMYSTLFQQLNRMGQVGVNGRPMDEAGWHALHTDFFFALTDVLLTAPESVRRAGGEYADAYNDAMKDPDGNEADSDVVSFARGYRKHRQQILEAQTGLLSAMRNDLAGGITY